MIPRCVICINEWPLLYTFSFRYGGWILLVFLKLYVHYVYTIPTENKLKINNSHSQK